MKDQPVTDAMLRQFLLGQVNDEERQRIEFLYITDPVLKEKILATEQDLVEDYLEDSLTTEERKRFLRTYAQTTAQQRKLRILQSVKEFAATEANKSRVSSAPISIWSRLFAGLNLKPVFVVPITVTALIAIVVTGLWLNRKIEQGNAEHLALQREIAELNVPGSLAMTLPNTVALELAPIVPRSGDQGQGLTLRDFQIVEFRLAWIQETYPRYRALIQRVGDTEPFTVDGIQAEADGKTIRLRLPARALKRGLNRIELTGIDARGSTDLTQEYSFTVNG